MRRAIAHSRAAAKAAPLPFRSAPRTRMETISTSGARPMMMPAHAVPWPNRSTRVVGDDRRLLPAQVDGEALDQAAADGRVVALDAAVDDRDPHPRPVAPPRRPVAVELRMAPAGCAPGAPPSPGRTARTRRKLVLLISGAIGCVGGRACAVAGLVSAWSATTWRMAVTSCISRSPSARRRLTGPRAARRELPRRCRGRRPPPASRSALASSSSPSVSSRSAAARSGGRLALHAGWPRSRCRPAGRRRRAAPRRGA